MGAGVDHAVFRQVVWQVQIGGICCEAELQHAHTGQLRGGAQCVYSGCNGAEVFGNQGQRARRDSQTLG